MVWQARSVVDERLEFCRLAGLEGANVSTLCSRFGISRQTGYVWLRRLTAGEPVTDRSRRPHASPRQTPPDVEDAVLDLGGINLPRFDGHAGIRQFFTQVFADMTHHAHFISNFTVARLDGDTAYCTAYVMGMGVARDGQSVLVYVKYFLDYVRTASGWKISRFAESGLMPLPESLTGIHGRD